MPLGRPSAKAAARHDRRVLIALLVIGMLWLVFLTLFTGASGGGETTGG